MPQRTHSSKGGEARFEVPQAPQGVRSTGRHRDTREKEEGERKERERTPAHSQLRRWGGALRGPPDASAECAAAADSADNNHISLIALELGI